MGGVAGVGVAAGVEGAEAEGGEVGAEVEEEREVGDMILTEGTQIATMIKTCICVENPEGNWSWKLNLSFNEDLSFVILRHILWRYLLLSEGDGVNCPFCRKKN